MPVAHYGVLKGRAIDRVIEYEPHSPHYQILVQAGEVPFRVAVNVKSRDHGSPELLFTVVENFEHVLTEELAALDDGFHFLPPKPESPALDYVRSNLFDRKTMVLLPHDLPGDENDLNEKVEMYVRRAVRNPEAVLYAFGSRWGPEHRIADKIWRFRPGNGVHNIHMNQGNPTGRYGRDNGVYQDGGMLIHYPRLDRWIGIFLAFQSQAWHTSDGSGYPDGDMAELGAAYAPHRAEPDYSVRILAALVNPAGGDPGRETVTLFNTTEQPIDLTGWTLLDRGKRRMGLTGVLPPHEPQTVRLSRTIQLSNSGGIITLLNPQGRKVHGVFYSKRQAQEQGRSIVF
ncbi:MAG: hypothetical protein OHK0029_28170 [Armatimonadaceae bacterium]